ncbi:MAG TPA: zf-HC2 domain-containing protein [Ktedonobacterales bacterium]
MRLTCEDLLAYLSTYLDGALDAELSAAAREHLATCEHCQVVLDSTQRVIVLGEGQRQRRIPEERRSALYERLRAALGAPERRV